MPAHLAAKPRPPSGCQKLCGNKTSTATSYEGTYGRERERESRERGFNEQKKKKERYTCLLIWKGREEESLPSIRSHNINEWME
jgi:hypothetical protein